jgi:hypothetical protein
VIGFDMSFIHHYRIQRIWLILIGNIWMYALCMAQTPVVTVHFANPEYSCVSQEYCLDVEFKADIPDQEVFGVNVRFFYDDELLELIDFRDFQGGYGPVAPDPPIIFTSEPAGPALFNFTGPAEFINGAIQLLSTDDPIYLDTDNFTKLFQICFDVDGPIPNLDTFCPPIVWDLEADPSNGGFLSGDDGVVITIVDPDPNNESYAAIENVVQYNWEYTGDGSPPFGQPINEVCSNINCALPVSLLYFKGQQDINGNLLEWKTTHEAGLLGFEIQKSHDRFSWISLGFLEPRVDGKEVHVYQFLDQAPSAGNNYYRLSQKESDQKVIFSPIINIVSLKESIPSLSIQPNPVFQESLHVSISGFPEFGMNFRLMNSMGGVVIQTVLQDPDTEFDISRVPSGIYLAMVNAPGIDLVKKVVIQH